MSPSQARSAEPLNVEPFACEVPSKVSKTTDDARADRARKKPRIIKLMGFAIANLLKKLLMFFLRIGSSSNDSLGVLLLTIRIILQTNSSRKFFSSYAYSHKSL